MIPRLIARPYSVLAIAAVLGVSSAVNAQCTPEQWVYTPMQSVSTSGARDAVIIDGPVPLLVSAGSFWLGGQSGEHGLAAWDGTQWTPYPAASPPTGDDVFAVQQLDGTLYIGGSFTTVNGQAAGKVARWTGTQWANAGTGLTGTAVYDLVAAGTDLWAAGDMTIGSVQTRVAKLVGGAWTSAGLTMTFRPTAIAAHNGDLYVAGPITGGPGLGPCALARCSGGVWTAVDTGLPISVIGLRSLNGELYALGGLTGQNPLVGRVYKRVAESWVQVGQNLPGWSADVASFNGDVYMVAGHPNNFVHAPLYKLVGNTWTAIAGTMSIDTDNGHTRLLTRGDELLLTTKTGLTVDASAERSFDTKLIAAGSYRPSSGWQTTLVSYGVFGCFGGANDVLVCGPGVVTRPALSTNDVATFDEANGWRSSGLTGYMFQISVIPYMDGILIGGSKSLTNLPRYQPGINKLVRWSNGTTWPMTRGLWDSTTDSSAGVGGPNITAVAESDGRFYAAPTQMSVGQPKVSLVWWDGQQWQPLGRSPNGAINAMCSYDHKLIVAGLFSAIGSTAPTIPAANICAFDGNAWSQLGAGLNGEVKAVATYNGRLYATGNFSAANAVPGVPAASGGLACWDGTRWRAVGSGLNVNGALGGGRLLKEYAGKLYVGGTFDRTGGTFLLGMARFDGATLQAFGGLQHFEAGNGPFAMSVYNGDLYIAGGFQTIGGKNAAGVATWRAPTVPRINSQPSVVAVQLGGTATLALGLEAAPLSAQWVRISSGLPLQDGPLPSGAVVSGAQSPSLTIAGITTSELTDYRCNLTYQCGTVSSGSITVSEAH